jgi:hypothetical protein
MSNSKQIFENTDKDVQQLVKKILAFVRKNRTARGSSVDKEIVRTIKETIS